MLNCKKLQAKLSAYIDKELSMWEMLEVEEHLSRCPKCFAELQAFRQVANLLGALPEKEPPQMLKEVLQNIPYDGGEIDMECKRIQPILSAYLDGELEPKEAEAAKEHLAKCLKCTLELERFRQATNLTRLLPEVEPPAYIRTVLAQRIAEKQKATERYGILEQLAQIWKSRTFRVPAYATVAAAAAGLFFLVWTHLKPITAPTTTIALQPLKKPETAVVRIIPQAPKPEAPTVPARPEKVVTARPAGISAIPFATGPSIKPTVAQPKPPAIKPAIVPTKDERLGRPAESIEMAAAPVVNLGTFRNQPPEAGPVSETMAEEKPMLMADMTAAETERAKEERPLGTAAGLTEKPATKKVITIPLDRKYRPSVDLSSDIEALRQARAKVAVINVVSSKY